jgi:hypothetical protein
MTCSRADGEAAWYQADDENALFGAGGGGNTSDEPMYSREEEEALSVASTQETADFGNAQLSQRPDIADLCAFEDWPLRRSDVLDGLVTDDEENEDTLSGFDLPPPDVPPASSPRASFVNLLRAKAVPKRAAARSTDDIASAAAEQAQAAPRILKKPAAAPKPRASRANAKTRAAAATAAAAAASAAGAAIAPTLVEPTVAADEAVESAPVVETPVDAAVESSVAAVESALVPHDVIAAPALQDVIAAPALVDDGSMHCIQSLAITLPSADIRCSKCNSVCDPLRSTGKMGGSWKCSKCNCKCTQLNRLFGCWPIPEFGRMSREQEIEFFKKSHDCSSMDMLDQLVLETMSETVRHKETGSLDGEWLPLAVWEKQGYCAKEILSSATVKNSKPNERFGMVYKIVVERDQLLKEREYTREKILQRKTEHAKKKVEKQETPQAQDDRAIEETMQQETRKEKNHKSKKRRKPSTSSGSDSSSSKKKSGSDASESNSSSSKKKKSKKESGKDKKKKKKNNKDTRNDKRAAKKEKYLRAQLKVAESKRLKDNAKGEREAHKVIAKLSGLELKVISLISSAKAMHDVPDFAIEGAKNASICMKKYIDEATKIIKGSYRGCLTFELSAVDDCWKKASAQVALLDGMMNSVRKSRSVLSK